VFGPRFELKSGAGSVERLVRFSLVAERGNYQSLCRPDVHEEIEWRLGRETLSEWGNAESLTGKQVCRPDCDCLCERRNLVQSTRGHHSAINEERERLVTRVDQIGPMSATRIDRDGAGLRWGAVLVGGLSEALTGEYHESGKNDCFGISHFSFPESTAACRWAQEEREIAIGFL